MPTGLVYYKLTLWAFGSGELKINVEFAPSKDSDHHQPGNFISLGIHPVSSAFAVHKKKAIY